MKQPRQNMGNHPDPLADRADAMAYAKETFRLLLDDEKARRAMGPLYSRCVEAMHRLAALEQGS